MGGTAGQGWDTEGHVALGKERYCSRAWSYGDLGLGLGAACHF